MTAYECTVSEAYKKEILSAKDSSTTVTGRSTGHPIRVIKNKLSRKLQQMERHGADPEEIAQLGVGALRNAVENGDVDFGSVMSGQIAGIVNQEQSCRDIIDDMMRDCADVFNNRNVLMREAFGK